MTLNVIHIFPIHLGPKLDDGTDDKIQVLVCVNIVRPDSVENIVVEEGK